MSIIIWTNQRTGSTSLSNALSIILNYDIKHEPFNLNREYDSTVKHWRKNDKKDELEIKLKEILSFKPAFKHCVEVQPPKFNQILAETSIDLGYKHLFLYRAETRERLLSLHFAKSTDLWFSKWVKKDISLQIADYESTPIDIEKLKKHDELCRQRLRAIFFKISRSKNQYTSMTYEKLYGENKEKTLEVLNNALINLFPGSKFSLDLNVLRNLQSTKMNIQNKYNDAPNIDEFNDAFGDYKPFSLEEKC